MENDGHLTRLTTEEFSALKSARNSRGASTEVISGFMLILITFGALSSVILGRQDCPTNFMSLTHNMCMDFVRSLIKSTGSSSESQEPRCSSVCLDDRRL